VSTENNSASPQYLVHFQGETQGPFDRSFIEAMVMAGVYPADVKLQVVGERKVEPFDQRRECDKQTPDSNRGDPAPPLQRKPQIGECSTDQSGGSAPALPPKPFSTEAKFAVGVTIAGALALFLIFVEVSSSTSKSSSSLTPPYRSSDSTPRPSTSSFPQSKPPAQQKPAIAETIYTPSPPPPSYAPSVSTRSPSFGSSSSSPAAEGSQIYRDASGRTYRVPNSAYYRLLTMKTAIESKKQILDSEEAHLDSLSTQVDRERIYLNRNSQYSVDTFNRKVNQVNSLNDRLQNLVDDFNRDVNAFNAELERVGTPIR